jgi:hypothetical protein
MCAVKNGTGGGGGYEYHSHEFGKKNINHRHEDSYPVEIKFGN